MTKINDSLEFPEANAIVRMDAMGEIFDCAIIEKSYE